LRPHQARGQSPHIRLYALVQAGDPEAIDVYLAEEDAQRALEDCLRDEPGWRGLLRVEAVELDEREASLN
jgi:hypothetical protein